MDQSALGGPTTLLLLPCTHQLQDHEFYDSIERELWEFAAFYRLDMPSVKSAAYKLMRQVDVCLMVMVMVMVTLSKP